MLENTGMTWLATAKIGNYSDPFELWYYDKSPNLVDWWRGYLMS
jgi:hypothetical protein